MRRVEPDPDKGSARSSTRFERALAVAGEGDALLKRFQGFFDGQVPGLELFDDGFEFGEGFFEIGCELGFAHGGFSAG